jgi:Protein of unknown function (DUF3574)
MPQIFTNTQSILKGIIMNQTISRPRNIGRQSVKHFALTALAAIAISGLSWKSAQAQELPPDEGPFTHDPTVDFVRKARPRCGSGFGAESFVRTELFFGLSRPGGVVSEAEFKAFVDARVTPRFPDGLTLISGVGQFREANQAITVEGSKLLILLYPKQDADANRKIEQIRSDYKQTFQQQSVLRADEASCASF